MIFIVFSVKNIYKTKIICVNKKIIRAFVDTHVHIPNMHRATFYHVVYFLLFILVHLVIWLTWH